MDDTNSGIPLAYPVDNDIIECNILNDDDDFRDERGSVDEQNSRDQVLEARRKWALIHFYALRPAFSISLILYLASITSGRGALTFRSGVIHPIRNLASLVQMESKSYTKCVQQYTNRTARHLEQLALDDQERARELLESNSKILKRGENAANECLHDVEKARESLAQWRKDGMTIPWKEVLFATDSNNTVRHSSSSMITENSTCSAEKRNRTEELLGEDHRIAERQMNNALQNFMSESHNSLKTIGDYALERFDYDWDYFIKGRIQPALDFLAEHSVYIQTKEIDLSYNVTEIERALQKQIVVVQHILEEAKEHIDLLQSKLQEFRGSINGFYINYNDLYSRMAKAADTVSEFLPPGMPLPDVFDLSDIHLADSFLPTTGLSWPELSIEYADIRKVSRDIADACLDILVEVLDEVQAQSLQGLHGSVKDLTQTLMEILELESYRPPQYQGSHAGILDIDHEIEFQSLRGQEALNWTAQAMTDLQGSTSLFQNLTVGDVGAPMAKNFDYNYTEEKSTTFELLNVLMPEFSLLENILEKILMLGDYAFLLDVLCCLVQWWKLSTMYEKGAMPDMPQIEYGESDRAAKQRPRANAKILLFIAKSFLNPIFLGFVCIFAFVAFLVVNFWVPHVQEMCVHSTNGTWFANNMLGPTLTNIAMTGGNAQYLLAEHFCYSSKNQLCANIQMQMETQLFSDKSSLEDLQTRHSRSLQTLELIEDCVDSSNVTAMVSEACCGLKGYRTDNCYSSSNYTCPIDMSTSPPSAYRPLESYIESSSCLEDIRNWALDDEKYECARLDEACRHIPCNGVNDNLIQSISNDTDCKIELWILYSFRFWASAIIQFMALYAICSLLYLGCRDFHWREISPDSIGLRTRLLENGALAKGCKVEERSEMISNEIRWFERKARLQIWLGAIFMSAYMVVMLILCVKD